MTREAGRPTEPWRVGDLFVVTALGTAGFAAIIAAWVGASGTTKIPTETAWLGVAIAAAVVAGAGNAAWLLAGQRAVRVRQRALAGRALALLPRRPEMPPDPAAAAATFPEDGVFLSAPRMAHFHRPGCHLMAGKPAAATCSEPEHRRAGRVPCGVCRPLEAVG